MTEIITGVTQNGEILIRSNWDNGTKQQNKIR